MEKGVFIFFLLLVVAVLTKLFILLHVQNLNQILTIIYTIVLYTIFSLSSRYFLFTVSENIVCKSITLVKLVWSENLT